MEKRPHRFDILREENEKAWRFWMYDVGYGEVFNYIGVGWEKKIPQSEQISMFEKELET